MADRGQRLPEPLGRHAGRQEDEVQHAGRRPGARGRRAEVRREPPGLLWRVSSPPPPPSPSPLPPALSSSSLSTSDFRGPFHFLQL